MSTPHKHAELIKAWADGAEIQYKNYSDAWEDTPNPSWMVDVEYRIKPAALPTYLTFLAFMSNRGTLFWVAEGLPEHEYCKSKGLARVPTADLVHEIHPNGQD
jgi:hypothetical protein